MPQHLLTPRSHGSEQSESPAFAPPNRSNESATPDSQTPSGFGHRFGAIPIFSAGGPASVQRDDDPDNNAQNMSLDPNAAGGQCIDPKAGGSSPADAPAPAPAPAPDMSGAGVAPSAGPAPDTTNANGGGGAGGGSGSSSSPVPDVMGGGGGNPDAANAAPGPGGDLSIPQLPGPVNDAVGVGLGVAGLIPGPIGTAATLASGAQTLTQSTPNPNDASYHDDVTMQGINLGLTGASLLGGEAAGPLGLVAAAGGMLGHGAQALGNGMIEGGIQNNPGQFGPDPMDNM